MLQFALTTLVYSLAALSALLIVARLALWTVERRPLTATVLTGPEAFSTFEQNTQASGAALISPNSSAVGEVLPDSLLAEIESRLKFLEDEGKGVRRLAETLTCLLQETSQRLGVVEKAVVGFSSLVNQDVNDEIRSLKYKIQAIQNQMLPRSPGRVMRARFRDADLD